MEAVPAAGGDLRAGPAVVVHPDDGRGTVNAGRRGRGTVDLLG